MTAILAAETHDDYISEEGNTSSYGVHFAWKEAYLTR